MRRSAPQNSSASARANGAATESTAARTGFAYVVLGQTRPHFFDFLRSFSGASAGAGGALHVSAQMITRASAPHHAPEAAGIGDRTIQIEEGKASAFTAIALETIAIPGEKSGRRSLWEFVHKNLGRAMFVLAIADVGLGLDIALAGYGR
jgi:hypothetical protein